MTSAFKTSEGTNVAIKTNQLVATPYFSKRKNSLTMPVNECHLLGATGLEPVTPSVSSLTGKDLRADATAEPNFCYVL